MIFVDVLCDNSNVVKHLTVSGHSGYGTKGTDVVCAAVSCLVQTSYVAMKQLLGSGCRLVRDINTSKENVFEYEITFYPTECKEKLCGMSTFLMTGLAQIGKQYKENVKLEINFVK